MSAMYQTFQNTPIFQTAWRGFLGSKWTDEVNVRDFIQNNYTQYDGDESFLAAPTSATHLLWERLQKLQKEEHEKGGVLECETEIVSSLTAYGPGYIDPELKDLERIVGLQTDKPLKRAFMPFGGIKMAEESILKGNDYVSGNPRYLTIVKNVPTFFSFGPELVTPDEVPDVNELLVQSVHNGEVHAENVVANMTHRPPRLVSLHSSIQGWYAGDILSTGTPRAFHIQDGDVAECRITGPDGFEMTPLVNPVVDLKKHPEKEV